MNLYETIKSHLLEVAKDQQIELAGEITEETPLLETGLDSLSFAVLVATLEERLGYDPFQLMEEPVYPQTFKEFTDCYARYGPKTLA